jgi:AsmA protein
VPDPRGLADAMGTPLALPDGALSALSLAGRVDATPARVSLSDARLAVDDIEATGRMAVDLSGPRPKIEGALTTGDLVLDRYLPADAGGGATTPGAGADGAGDQGWSDAPIDLSALAVADADVTINAGSVTIRDTRLGATELALRLDDRRLTVDVPQTGLYGGSGHVTIGVNGRASPASLSLKGAFQGLDLLPLLTAATGSDRLEGTGRTEFDLTARGSSQKALIGGLAGRGLYEVTDGALRGINIAAMIRNLGGAFDDGGAERKTDFARLGGSFTAERGIVTNRDTELQAPLLRVTAAGTVNLPERRLDYRIEPKAVANLEGQGGRADLSGLMVPVIVEGPWSNLSYRPDLEGALRQGLNDPEAVRRAIEGAREGDVGDALKGLLGGGQSGGDAGDDNATDGSEPANPLDQLKGLFKR